ncbi:hypothetical protein AAFX24_27710 [Vibrio mediterranei]|uniref:hypothetical protein n=1 Tax=Vibrio mediterranei TaxID=689 RepID=UPI0038CE2FDB
MLIDIKLKNKRTGIEKTQRVDDATSPSGGYTQSYADRLGSEYAAHRAPEMLNPSSCMDDQWQFVKATYVHIPQQCYQRTS